MGFAAGFSVGWNAVDSALKRAEEDKRLQEEKNAKIAKETRDYNNSLFSDATKEVNALGELKIKHQEAVNAITTSDKYASEDEKAKVTSNINRVYSSEMKRRYEQASMKTQQMSDPSLFKPLAEQLSGLSKGLDLPTYHKVEDGDKYTYVTNDVYEQYLENPSQFGLGRDSNLYLKDKDGSLTNNMVAKGVSFKGSQEKAPSERDSYLATYNLLPDEEKAKYNNDFNEFIASEKSRLESKYKDNNNLDDETKVKNLTEDILMYQKELETAKTYNESSKIFELENKINKSKNDMNKILSSNKNIKDPSKSAKANINKFVAQANSQVKKGIEPSPVEAKSALEKQMDGNVNFNNADHVKKIQQTISYAGKEELMSLFSKKYNEAKELGKEQQSYVDGKFLPLLKAESDGGSNHATNAYYKNKVYDIVAYMATQDDPSNKDVSLYGKVKEIANQMKSGTGNKKMIDLIYQQDIEPVIEGFKGKSAEFYKDDWETASKQYQNMEGVGSFQELWSGQFANLDEAVSSLQDYIDDNNEGLAAWFADVTSTDSSNVSKFLTNTFPKLQLAYKLENPDEPLLNPIDLVKMINKDYESNTFSDYGSPKQGSRLYNLITLANSIRY